MSKTGTDTNNAKKQRIPNKNKKISNNAVQEKSMKLRRFMDSRSSLRQSALTQKRSSFQGNQFPLAAEAARKAAFAPIHNRNFNLNHDMTLYRPRPLGRPVQNRSINGGSAFKIQTMGWGDENIPAQQPVGQNDDDVVSHAVNPELGYRTDEQILPHQMFEDVIPNNFYIDFDTYQHSDHVLLEILKGHPLRFALSATATVPNIYVQQMWHSMHPIMVDGKQRLRYELDNMELEVSPNSLRRMLRLPRAHDMPNDQFEDFADDETLCRDFMAMGYKEPLPMVWKIKRKSIPGCWNYLFPILLKCLTAQSTGFDKGNKSFYQMLHAVYFDRKVDYVIPIWTMLLDFVQGKGKQNKKMYIPYLRFLQLIIFRSMSRFPEITRRMGDRKPYLPPKLKYQIERIPAHEPGCMIIPLSLLQYADLTHPAVVAYREKHYRDVVMEQPPPVVPDPAARAERSEGQVEPSVSEEQGGDLGRGDAAEHVEDDDDDEEDDDDHFDYGGVGLEIQVERPHSTQSRRTIGRGVAIPTTQLALPVHSAVSQQIAISPIFVPIPRISSTPSRPRPRARIVDPLDLPSSLDRTQPSSTADEPVCLPFIEQQVASEVAVFHDTTTTTGLDVTSETIVGSPTSVASVATLSVGATMSAIVTTVPLREVTCPLPEFLTMESLESTLQVVSDILRKGKMPASEPGAPSAVQQDEPTTDELKTQLFLRLLGEANPTEEHMSLLDLLQPRSPPMSVESQVAADLRAFREQYAADQRAQQKVNASILVNQEEIIRRIVALNDKLSHSQQATATTDCNIRQKLDNLDQT